MSVRLNALVFGYNDVYQLLDSGLRRDVTDVVAAPLHFYWHVRHLLLGMDAEGQVVMAIHSN